MMQVKRELFGLRLIGTGLGYAYSSQGKRVKPLIPRFVSRVVVHVWNEISCLLRGHDRTLEGITDLYDENGMFHCTMCCQLLEPKKPN